MKTEICQNCGRTIGNLEVRHLFNGIIVCAQCDNQLRQQPLPQTRKPLQAIETPVRSKRDSGQIHTTENILVEVHPAMFRNRPILFVILAAFAVYSYGLGIIFLVIWWLRCQTTTLIVTNLRTTIRQGILSKNTNEVRHKDAKNIKVSQSFGQRIFGAGTLQVSSAGQSDIEIVFAGLPSPQKVAGLIREHQE